MYGLIPFLSFSGFTDGQASSLSLSVLKGFIAEEGLVRAYNDVFLLIAFFLLVVLIPIFVMKK